MRQNYVYTESEVILITGINNIISNLRAYIFVQNQDDLQTLRTLHVDTRSAKHHQLLRKVNYVCENSGTRCKGEVS